MLYADYSDPDVIRVGEDYFLTASSFTATPGLPILRSRDLVNWTLAGHALANLPAARYHEFQPGAGVWAPALREHAGTFYIFLPLPDEGIYVVTAPHPTGPWTPPRLLVEGRGLIDPCPFWDDDGRAYLVHAYARSRSGIKDRLRLRPMAPDTSRLLGDGEIVFHDPIRHPTIEGPKLYKRQGWYYILAPAGGVTRGWQVALRARRIFGPYEDRVVLEQGRTEINGPHQGALVDTPSGEWWFVHFQDAGVYGRVVHLNPVTWQDGWPLMGAAVPGSGRREPVLRRAKPQGPSQPIAVPQTSDELDGAGAGGAGDGGGVGGGGRRLGPQWQWQANHRDDWLALGARPGFLRLFGRPVPPSGLGRAPNLLLQKLPATAFTAETSVELGPATEGPIRAGLVIAGEATAALTVESSRPGDPPPAVRVTLSVDDRQMYAAPIAPGAVALAVDFQTGGACRFSYRAAGVATAVTVPVTFQARAGRWVGAKIGLVASAAAGPVGAAGATAGSPYADFDYLRFTPPAAGR